VIRFLPCASAHTPGKSHKGMVIGRAGSMVISEEVVKLLVDNVAMT
jgi:hypothetical protein